MLGDIDLRRLPPPPASASQWRARAMPMCMGMPGLQAELPDVPIGWFSLIEVGIAEMRRVLPARCRFVTTQLKEKFGTLRWYGHVEHACADTARDTGVEAAIDWAEAASRRVCALFGTADGELDRTEPWLLTLSPRARQLRAQKRAEGNDTDLAILMYPRWHDD